MHVTLFQGKSGAINTTLNLFNNISNNAMINRNTNVIEFMNTHAIINFHNTSSIHALMNA